MSNEQMSIGEDGLLPAKIIVVDDDPDILVTARVVLSQGFSEVEVIRYPAALERVIEENRDFDILLLDMNFTIGHTSGKEGLKWLEKVKARFPDRPVIMITAYASINLAVKAMKQGAFDFIVKPWNNDAFEETVYAAFKSISSKDKQAHSEAISGSWVVASDEMLRLAHLAERVAVTDASILISGESGTGKEVLARRVHEVSPRRSGPFVKVDLATLPSGLFESALFGHKKGAFTDAVDEVTGMIELANKGTLFLDGIGTLPVQLQPKLLSALQSKTVTKVGSSLATAVDFRLICATSQNIAALVRDKLFREDLYFRINTVEIEVPPLRERPADIDALTDHFIKKFGKQYGKAVTLSDDARLYLQELMWPGNIRQLEHFLERGIILSEGSVLQRISLEALQGKRDEEAGPPVNLEEVEKETIARALKKHRGNLKQAARELGLGRSTLYRKLRRYGL